MSALFIFLFALFILLAIGLHEFGHFATAKWFGIKVEKFFIGFPPKMWSRRKGETEYGIGWIPAGGYVRISGMNPLEEVPPEDRGRTFTSKPAWQRAIVLVAGSFTHFVIAFLLTAGLLAAVGVPERTREIAAVESSDEKGPLPAAAAGFRVGDEIVAVEGRAVSTWEEMSELVRARPDQRVRITVQRDGRTVELVATLARRERDGETIGFLGVGSRVVNVPRPLGPAIVDAGSFVGRGSWESLRLIGKVLSPSGIGRLLAIASGDEVRTERDPTSIVGAGRLAGNLAREGGFFDLLFMVAALNVVIGVFNLLPLPPLDGAHLAVLGFGKLTRREVDMRKLLPVWAAATSFIIGLFVLLLYLDIVRPLPSIPG